MAESFWPDAPRKDFTAFCAAKCNAPIPVDDVSDREVHVIQQRRDWLATIDGVKQAKSNGAIKRAVVGSRN